MSLLTNRRRPRSLNEDDETRVMRPRLDLEPIDSNNSVVDLTSTISSNSVVDLTSVSSIDSVVDLTQEDVVGDLHDYDENRVNWYQADILQANMLRSGFFSMGMLDSVEVASTSNDQAEEVENSGGRQLEHRTQLSGTLEYTNPRRDGLRPRRNISTVRHTRPSRRGHGRGRAPTPIPSLASDEGIGALSGLEDSRESSEGATDSLSNATTASIIQCAICLEQHKGGGQTLSSTHCGHVFCTPCIKRALRSINKCPVCRCKITMRKVHALFI